MASPVSSLFLILLLNLYSSIQVSAELLLEEGYTVSTVLDGNKLSINPSSVLPRLGGTHDLLILDSPRSAIYTVPFPISKGSDVNVNLFSGNGTEGFSDGDFASVMFDRPRSFAVDLKGNVYVADKHNYVIRKISKSGVTTIAGGHTRKQGNVDGPAQNASFSDDFELTFAPEICALLISDRGNRLVRQMNLKPEDCTSGSRSGLGLTWVSVLGVSCLLLGLVIGLAAYPFLASREVFNGDCFSKTLKHGQIYLRRRVLIVCFDIRSAIASSNSLVGRLVGMSLSHLSLMFRIHKLENKVQNQSPCREPVSLLDSDCASNHETTKSQMFADQLKDLISFDEGLDGSEVMNNAFKQGNGDHERSDILTYSHGKIDGMMQANVLDFTEQTRRRNPLDGSLVGSSGLVKRK